MQTVDATYARFVLLVSPVAWEGTILWFFGVEPDSANVLSDAHFGGWVYFSPSWRRLQRRSR